MKHKLLIAGSRYHDNALDRVVIMAIEKAKELGLLIVVGDNPLGVDAMVVQLCIGFGVDYAAYGISKQPRNTNIEPSKYINVPLQKNRSAKIMYGQRDQHMIDLADVSLFVWNESSEGTYAGYLYAKRGVNANSAYLVTAKTTKEQLSVIWDSVQKKGQ